MTRLENPYKFRKQKKRNNVAKKAIFYTFSLLVLRGLVAKFHNSLPRVPRYFEALCDNNYVPTLLKRLFYVTSDVGNLDCVNSKAYISD